MCNEMVVRRFAGTFILASLALGWWVNPAWFLFTAFVGVNLIQSTFTRVCPLERILGRFRLFGCRPLSEGSR
jgi:Inner membrane protein YgaP-like, transmembrane domain